MGEHAPGYYTALTPKEWENLCLYLEMSLTEVLAMSGPELLRATLGKGDARRRARLLSELRDLRNRNAGAPLLALPAVRKSSAKD
jgi:hypothetical protein